MYGFNIGKAENAGLHLDNKKSENNNSSNNELHKVINTINNGFQFKDDDDEDNENNLNNESSSDEENQQQQNNNNNNNNKNQFEDDDEDQEEEEYISGDDLNNNGQESDDYEEEEEDDDEDEEEEDEESKKLNYDSFFGANMSHNMDFLNSQNINSQIGLMDPHLHSSQLNFEEPQEEIELPAHACAYCATHELSTVVKCMHPSCGKWFCNGKGKTKSSHIITHLVKSKHKEVALHPESSFGDTTLECFNCGCKNIFLLGFITARTESVVVLLCRDPCASGPSKEVNWDMSSWQPLINGGEKAFCSWLVKTPSQVDSERSRQITIQQILRLEEFWKMDPEATLLDIEAPRSDDEKPASTQLAYKDAYEYREIISPLIELEAKHEKELRESLSQSGISIEWSQGINKRYTATFPFSRSDLEFKVVPGDELKLQFISSTGGVIEWEDTGRVIHIDDENLLSLETKSRCSFDSGPKGSYRMEMVWRSTSSERILSAMKSFAIKEQALSSYLYHALLGHPDIPPAPLDIQLPTNFHLKNLPRLNESQISAVNKVLTAPLSLIQGPPGTGKTHVILGLISVLLHSTIVPKVKSGGNNLGDHLLKDRELSMAEKRDLWNISQPWFNKEFPHIRDNYELIDYDFEERDQKRKRDLWRKLRDTGSVKGGSTKRRILLCAPSNGAVDEIVSRLIRDGLLNADGRKYNPNLVRVGPGSHSDVESVSLDYMVRCRQQLMNSNSAIPSSSASTAAATSGSSRSTQDTSSIRTLVLDEADIVATTLSFSGASLLTKMAGGFDIVIIDEAAQAVETSTLIPIQHGCKKVVLVGDPKQLPATIISPLAIKYKYDQSLFQRLQEKNSPHMLTTQYRMHSLIRAFPSRHFYQDLLLDGPNIPSRATHYHSNPFFGPLVFYDLSWSTETKPGGGSVFNEHECKMAMYLFQLFTKVYPDEDFASRIGIISPYRQQVLALREIFKNYPGISIDTVDGFQGREREIIIFSCVRAPVEEGAGIGFLSDVRRMNVALTRPRSSLLILGNTKALSINKDWNELIQHTQNNQQLIPVTKDQPLEIIIPTFTTRELFTELSEKGQQIVIPKPRTEEEINLQKQKDIEKRKKQHKRQKQKSKENDKKKQLKKRKELNNNDNNNNNKESSNKEVQEITNVEVVKDTEINNTKRARTRR